MCPIYFKYEDCERKYFFKKHKMIQTITKDQVQNFMEMNELLRNY